MHKQNTAKIVVVGSVNLDYVARASRLPLPGETITGADLQKYPGGKGANQALAAKRLGADVSLCACVGQDSTADEALQLLVDGGVNLDHCCRSSERPTGVALIVVGPDGENQIVVAPGANRELDCKRTAEMAADALICQLEVPAAVLLEAAASFAGLFCINLAPAREIPAELIERADIIVVNETEANFYGDGLADVDAIVVTTTGASGASARQRGELIAQCGAPRVEVVDTVGAGDTFTAALVVQLANGAELEQALSFACAAGSLATTRRGAQPSLPTAEEVEGFLRDVD